jgi:hypothetical protein
VRDQYAIEFCDDQSLGYRRSLTPLAGDQALTLDASYRLAHLPLVNAQHPDVIAANPDKGYDMGRHARIHSLVLPIPHDLLEQSLDYQELQTAFRTGPLAHKLAWDIIPRRRALLHATLCGSLGAGETQPDLGSDFRNALKAIQPFEVELRGILSGNVNIGRFYFKAYPEMRGGSNCIQTLQNALGRKETDLYLVGLHNLMDHLTQSESRWLLRTVESWWDRPILRFTAKKLWLLSAKDDLVLDARVEESFALKTVTGVVPIKL